MFPSYSTYTMKTTVFSRVVLTSLLSRIPNLRSLTGCPTDQHMFRWANHSRAFCICEHTLLDIRPPGETPSPKQLNLYLICSFIPDNDKVSLQAKPILQHFTLRRCKRNSKHTYTVLKTAKRDWQLTDVFTQQHKIVYTF